MAEGHKEILQKYRPVSSEREIRKNPASQDSPPAAGRESGILPFRRSAFSRRVFYITGNEVSCYVRKLYVNERTICIEFFFCYFKIPL